MLGFLSLLSLLLYSRKKLTQKNTWKKEIIYKINTALTNCINRFYLGISLIIGFAIHG
jgi:hypothetical protein